MKKQRIIWIENKDRSQLLNMFFLKFNTDIFKS